MDHILGAKKSGLHKDYVSKLEAQEVFTTPDWVLEERKKYPKPGEMRKISLSELQEHAKDDIWQDLTLI